MHSNKGRLLGVATTLFLVHFALEATAVPVQVDWTATLTPFNATSLSPGTGQLSGSLGIYDVSAVGDAFNVPFDGSLSVLASGFSGGFPNGVYALTRSTSQTFQIEFTSVGPTAAEFAANFIDNNAGILSTVANPCSSGGVSTYCFVSLFDISGTGEDMAIASFGIDGTNNDSSGGTVALSFTVLGSTNPVPEPSSAVLFVAGGLLVGRRIGQRRVRAA